MPALVVAQGKLSFLLLSFRQSVAMSGVNNVNQKRHRKIPLPTKIWKEDRLNKGKTGMPLSRGRRDKTLKADDTADCRKKRNKLQRPPENIRNFSSM